PRPQRRGGRGWMVCSIILLVLLALSTLVIFSQFAGSVMHVRSGTSMTSTRYVGPRLDEAVLEDNNASAKICVIDVDGIISGSPVDQDGYSMVDVIKAQLDRAQDDRRVKAVILKVDSPGGEVLASDEISDAIKNFQAGRKSNGQDEEKSKAKPVIVSMGNLAASGGYYISAPCRYIVANKMTITGSIGVIMHGWNYRALMDKIGVTPEVYKSGKFKDMLSGTREPGEIPPEERAMVQALIDEVYGDFKQVVADGRKAAYEKNKDKGRELADDWTNYADGRVLSGPEALKLGFVDKIGNFQTAVECAKDIAGIGDANLIRYQERYDISDLFHLFGSESKSEARTVKIDLGLDTPRLQQGHLYFLSPVFSN
ncbi:MAG TPA: signal peptide peptidase SppA, partial [Candidatus Polarisedimenticolia bacterium]|nr:signal peptide peptidase SppA [Candidatus Polarisedimenticolia bacterium]